MLRIGYGPMAVFLVGCLFLGVACVSLVGWWGTLGILLFLAAFVGGLWWFLGAELRPPIERREREEGTDRQPIDRK